MHTAPAGNTCACCGYLVKEANDLACDVLSPRLFMVHDAGGCGEDDVAELTRWQKLDDPLLKIAQLDVVAWADDTGFVEAEGGQ